MNKENKDGKIPLYTYNCINENEAVIEYLINVRKFINKKKNKNSKTPLFYA